MNKTLISTLIILILQSPALADTVKQTSTTTSTEYSSDYILGGGDKISIEVLEFPEYSAERIVPEGGVIQLTLLGNVSVSGLTQEQTAKKIETLYKRYLKRPEVKVNLLSARSVSVVVSGEVNRPGNYTVNGAGTLSSVLSQAEGVTLAADLHKVELRRKGKIKVVDLTELISGGDNDIKLLDGDVVYLQATKEVNTVEIKQTSTSAFAASVNTPRTVTVVGEVNRPGSYTLIGDDTNKTLPTLTKAIQSAGGITSTANIRMVELRRFTKVGTIQGIKLDLWSMLQNGDNNQDTLLQNGDTIIIPKGNMTGAESTILATSNFSPASINVSVIGEVKTPGVTSLPPNTPLNQAILAAGGFNNSRAKKSSVELIRVNTDGTVSKTKIKVNLANNIGTSNPILKANDVIVIGRSSGAKVGDTLGTVFSPLRAVLGIFGL